MSLSEELAPEAGTPALKGPLPGLADLFADILEKGSDLRVRVTGRSMAPFLKGGEILIIRKVLPSDIKRGDLILFRTSNGPAALHRVIGRSILNGAYLFRTKGDGLRTPDGPVPEDRVMGKVCRLERLSLDGKVKVLDLEGTFQRRMNFFRACRSSLGSGPLRHFFR